MLHLLLLTVMNGSAAFLRLPYRKRIRGHARYMEKKLS